MQKPKKILRLLFGTEDRVNRQTYFFWGIGLMIAKYAGEAALYFGARSTLLTPFQFISPMVASRYPGFSSLPDWFLPSIVLWSLPFIWIGVGMSIRRAADANLTPWLGLLFFVPALNFLLMLALSTVPSSKKNTWEVQPVKKSNTSLLSALAITFVLAFTGTILTWFNTNFLKTYSASLFVGSPLLLGLVQGYFLNFKGYQGIKKTLGFVCVTILLINLFLLLFALEGVICLAMALPISLALGAIGAFFGAAIAKHGKRAAIAPAFLLIALPIFPLVESSISIPHQDVVFSSIVINAEPAKVWPNVISFADLPPTTDWLFKLGVAYPVRARIEGVGNGAVRYCEFSTGAFVEPITNWDEPNRLAFDVRFQPRPMKELSFYDHVDAPHLDGYFRSVRGEFRLVPLGAGKTRLEGRTWYQTEIQPGWYWQIYGRWFIHKIHGRVLDHIKALSERNALSPEKS